MWHIDGPDIAKTLGDVPDVARLGKLSPEETAHLQILYKKYEHQKGLIRKEYAASPIKAKESIIHSLYKRTEGKGTLRQIRIELQDGVSTCPVCGYNYPNTLDHFMPEKAFGALAVCRQNLIPVCSKCNSHKSDRLFENFIHAYLTDFPIGVRFLRAIVSVNNRTHKIAWRFEIVEGALSDELYQRVCFQWQFVSKRIQKESVSFLHQMLDPIEAQTDIQLRRQLLRKAIITGKNNGLNHWRTALMDSIAQCPDFGVCELNMLIARKRYRRDLGV